MHARQQRMFDAPGTSIKRTHSSKTYTQHWTKNMALEQESREALINHARKGTRISFFQRDATDPHSVLFVVGTTPIGMIHSWGVGYDGVRDEMLLSLTWGDGFVVTLPFESYVDPIEGVPDDVKNSAFQFAIRLTGDATWEAP